MNFVLKNGRLFCNSRYWEMSAEAAYVQSKSLWKQVRNAIIDWLEISLLTDSNHQNHCPARSSRSRTAAGWTVGSERGTMIWYDLMLKIVGARTENRTKSHGDTVIFRWKWRTSIENDEVCVQMMDYALKMMNCGYVETYFDYIINIFR